MACLLDFRREAGASGEPSLEGEVLNFRYIFFGFGVLMGEFGDGVSWELSLTGEAGSLFFFLGFGGLDRF